MNFVPGTIGADGQSVQLDLAGSGALPLGRSFEPGRKVIVGLRPEHLTLADAGKTTLTLPVAVVESTGSMTYITTATSPELTLVETRRTDAKAGDSMGVSIAPAHVHLFDPGSEKAI